MKKLMLAGAMLLTVTGFAQAADMFLKAPPPPAPVFAWSGFYIGATAGASWTNENLGLSVVNGPNQAFNVFDIPAINALGSDNTVNANATFGGKVGYNWQWNPLVFGVEADIFSLHYNHTAAVTGTPFTSPAGGPLFGFATFNSNVSTSWASTVRGRLGFATDHLLLYGTAGAAFGKVSFSNSYRDFSPLELGFGLESTTASQTKVGWAAGGGLDYLLTPSWVLSVEYLHIDLGTLSAVGTVHSLNPTTASFNFTTDPTSDLVRGSIAYKF
jgi:outer membrane immunogenic protein